MSINSWRQNEPDMKSRMKGQVKYWTNTLRLNDLAVTTNSKECYNLSRDYVWGCDDQIIWTLSRKVRNKVVKVINGNRLDKTNILKIINWNLGPRLWINKTDDICHMTTDIKPDVAIISEANLQYTEDLHLINIPGYKINTTKDYLAHGLSRLVVLTREELNYQILNDRMSEDISTIWLKFLRKGKKPFILCAIYREHQLMNRPGPNMSKLYQNQRWISTLDQWTAKGGTEELLVAGDMNLDHIRWDNLEQEIKYMVETTKERVETLGFAQLVKGPTRFWRDVCPSLLDQVWSNCPERVQFCKNLSRPIADHNIIETQVNLKSCPRTNLETEKKMEKSEHH